MQMEVHMRTTKANWGVVFQPGAVWLGMHYSKYDRRFCINLVPFLTLWISRAGGRAPLKPSLYIHHKG